MQESAANYTRGMREQNNPRRLQTGGCGGRAGASASRISRILRARTGNEKGSRSWRAQGRRGLLGEKTKVAY
jgi:hypothetical protein